MKLKGIKPLEQHIEKIVLGLILIVLLGVVSMQFLVQPNAVEVSPTRKVAPESVYTELEGQAQRIESQLSDLQPSLPKVAPTDLVARYDSAFEDSASSTMRLSSALGRGVDISENFGEVDSVGVQNSAVAALAVPTTSRPIALSAWATLDPYAMIEVPAYANYVPSVQPFDFASVSIEASFNGVDLRSALTGNDGMGGIPRKFWAATGVTILGFEVERQQLMPDGTWGTSEPIVTPPMTALPTRSITPDEGLPQLTQLVSNASSAFDDVAHPMFPPTIAGEEWTPPSERVASESNDLSEADKIRRRLASRERELARLEDRPVNTGTTRPGGGGKTANRTDPGSGSRPSGNTDRNRIKIERLREEIRELQDELRDLGEDIEPHRASRGARDGVDVLEMENIQLWAHDLGVEPGASYRYRSRVVLNNPLFRKGPSFDPNDAQQQSLTKDPFARGQWSTWSDTVLVGAEEYFFVSSAEPANTHASSPKANIELFKMYYGHYRRSTIPVEPGAKLQSNARLSGRLVTVDAENTIIKDAVEQMELYQSEETDEVPEGFQPVQGRLKIDLGAYLLEIAIDPIPGTDENGNPVIATQLILRDSGGNLIVRRSSSGREESDAYKLVASSAGQASQSELRLSGQSAVSPSYELFPDVTQP